jgi:hypothetical protein
MQYVARAFTSIYTILVLQADSRWNIGVLGAVISALSSDLGGPEFRHLLDIGYIPAI